LRREADLLADLCKPEGALLLLGLGTESNRHEVARATSDLSLGFRQRGVFATDFVVYDPTTGAGSPGSSPDVLPEWAQKLGIAATVQALRSTLFRPNVFLLWYSKNRDRRRLQTVVLREAREQQIGVILYAPHDNRTAIRSRTLNVWLRPPDRTVNDPEDLDLSGMNLTLLTAYRLARTWKARLHLIALVADDDEVTMAATHRWLDTVREECRLPRATSPLALHGPIDRAVAAAPDAAVQLLPMDLVPEPEVISELVESNDTTWLIVRDSGLEDALV
jgi:hypothetical protein